VGGTGAVVGRGVGGGGGAAARIEEVAGGEDDAATGAGDDGADGDGATGGGFAAVEGGSGRHAMGAIETVTTNGAAQRRDMRGDYAASRTWRIGFRRTWKTTGVLAVARSCALQLARPPWPGVVTLCCSLPAASRWPDRCSWPRIS
jgi:hypothetical protein